MYPHGLYQTSDEINAGYPQGSQDAPMPSTWQQPNHWQAQSSYPRDNLCNPVFAQNLCMPQHQQQSYPFQRLNMLGQEGSNGNGGNGNGDGTNGNGNGNGNGTNGNGNGNGNGGNGNGDGTNGNGNGNGTLKKLKNPGVSSLKDIAKMYWEKPIGKGFIITYLLFMPYAAILSWRCNSAHGFPLPVKIVSSLFAGLFSYNYLISYFFYKSWTCNPKRSLKRVKSHMPSSSIAKASSSKLSTSSSGIGKSPKLPTS